jgi:hypothetical protein
MGKKQDAAKKEAKKQRAEAKQKKSSTKKQKKELNERGEPDIETILAEIRAMEEDEKAVSEMAVEKIYPRSSALFVANPAKEGEFFVHGGECYDGQKTSVYRDLMRLRVEKKEWAVIKMPNSPPPRSGHHGVAYKEFIYLFGGEFTSPTGMQFYHYHDTWRLDTKEMAWENVTCKRGPQARSGHRMVVWKQYIYTFGGFYDNGRDVKYFNDLWRFDTVAMKWEEIKFVAGSMLPTERSGCVLFVHGDNLFVWGGYCKVTKKAESESGLVHTDMWCCRLSADVCQWERVKKSGRAPGPRSGCAFVYQPIRKRCLIFGGVRDMESTKKKDEIRSIFYNEIFAFNCEQKKWTPLSLKKSKVKKKKAAKMQREAPAPSQSQDNDNDNDNDNGDDADDDTYNSDMEQDQEQEQDEGVLQSQGLSFDEEVIQRNLRAALQQASKSVAEGNGASAEMPAMEELEDKTQPAARFNAMMTVYGTKVLLLFGGLLEAGDVEFTLSDVWKLDMQRLTHWECLVESDHHQQLWMGDEDGESEEGESSSESEASRAASDADEDEDEENADAAQGDHGADSVAMLSQHEIRKRLALGDESNPRPGEVLRDFYERTRVIWALRAQEQEESADKVGKALFRDGFALAEERFEMWQKEMGPLAQRLIDLELEAKRRTVRKR